MAIPARFARLIAVVILASASSPAHARTFDSSVTAGQPGGDAATTPAVPTGSLTATELDQLLGPIALYPDALLANVLAASVYPDEVKQAAGYVASGGDKKLIDSRTWEPPVKAIAKVPDVARLMGEYMDWTTSLGRAYLTQAQDVMASVQRLRAKAHANGSLKSTDQQQVVVDGSTIVIKSPDPEVVYVPYYQPDVVYVDDDDDEWVAGVVGFGAGVVVGAVWADLACDWHHGCVGWGDVDINIDRGDINIDRGDRGQRGDRGNRIGQEGNAWTPNRAKPLATSRTGPSQRAGAAPAAGRPQISSGGRAPAGMAQPTTRAARPATPATRTPSPSAGRVPAVPPAQRAQSAYRGGSDTRAVSNRGASSRQSAQRSSGGGRSSPARGGRGGGRGGGRR